MLINKINSLKITEDEIKDIIINIETITEKLKNVVDYKKQIELIDEVSKYRNKYLTLYWVSYIGYLKDIKSEIYLASEDIIGKYDSKYNNSVYKFYEVIDKIENKEKLITKYGKRFFDIAHNQKILLSDKNNELFQKEKQLIKEYRKTLNDIRVNFNDETLSLVKLNKYLISADRKVRKQAYDTRYEALESVSDKLESIFKEIIKIRQKISENSGFKSYAEFGYTKMNRIDYDINDITKLKENVIKYLVPLLEKIKVKQRERLSLEKLEYYDTECLFKDGNAKPKYELNDIIKKTSNILRKLNKTFGDVYDYMIEEGLIDLEDTENKSNGGITTFLPEYKCPIFVKRYTGIEYDIITIFHEFGHSLQLYLNKEKHLHENRWPTFDICEIHSTTMQLLSEIYAKDIFEEDMEKYHIKTLTEALETIIEVCLKDDFQTEIYSNPNYTIKRTNSVRPMTAQRPWTGWSRNRKEVLPLLPLLPLASGETTELTLSTPPATLTSPLRWNVP